jgi:mono/diheme cytochrome c family protein
VGILSSAKAQSAGAKLFASRCAICHGANGDGHGLRQDAMSPGPANLTLPPWSQTTHAGQTFLAIRDGVPQTAMAPWPTLTDAQVWELVAYIETLSGNG